MRVCVALYERLPQHNLNSQMVATLKLLGEYFTSK